MAPTLPEQFNFWPQQAGELSPAEVEQLYESGFAGAYQDEEAETEFESECLIRNQGMDADGIAHFCGLADSGAGKLTILFPHIFKLYPDCLPGGAQARGDCVSWSSRNAALTTMCCEIAAAKPDEVTGRVEGAPEVPTEGVKFGVLSTEAIYWWRRHGGDGWSCPAAANVLLKESGLWLRKNYDSLGVDLTRYSGGTAGKYGSRPPEGEISTGGREHLIRTATTLRSSDELRDFLANGYGVSSCGGEGFSSTRDENGVSKRQGSWAHALAYLGFDDRDEVKQKYGGPLVLVQNSWGQWNKGPQRILGTQIDIPVGSFWARWSDVSRRSMIAFSGVAGWPARSLPDYVSVL